MLRVEMLSTGDEVLHGQILDTNSAWLADYLFQQGLPMRGRSTVGDSLSALVEALIERSQIADVLIVNGGLGPTSDDLSAQAAAAAAGVGLVEQAAWIERMEAYFRQRGKPMAEANRKQAQIPANSEMLDNSVGTACGFVMSLNRCLLFFTPGVPSEFKVMVDKQILPYLRQRFTLTPPPLCLRLTTFGCAESELAAQLDSMQLPTDVTLGYRSSAPIIELKLTGPEAQRSQMEQAWQQVRQVAGDNAIFEGTLGLPTELANQLKERGYTLALSEQFTGGLLNLQLQSAEAPLKAGEFLPAQKGEDLALCLQRATAIAERSGASLGLAVSTMDNFQLSVALHTPQGVLGQTLGYQAQRHGLKLRQEMIGMLALDMLRRWLKGLPICGQHGWLEVIAVQGE